VPQAFRASFVRLRTSWGERAQPGSAILNPTNPLREEPPVACKHRSPTRAIQTVRPSTPLMQSILNHPLVVDLPEHKETIQALKSINAHFKHLLDQYHTVDEEIVRIETEVEPASDERTEQLKRRRVLLKDELMGLILKSEALAR